MALSNYQEEVEKWVVKETGYGYWQPHEILARITEEVGELARLINHVYGPKKKKSSESEQEIGEEIADIIFALACLANSQGIDLDKSFEQVMDKARNRDANRFDKVSS